MNDNDDIFGKDFMPDPLPQWKPKNEFKFGKGEAIKFSDTLFHIYEVTDDYATIHIRKKYVTAKLMQFMDTVHNAVYIGPMIEWTDGVHVTFKRKS